MGRQLGTTSLLSATVLPWVPEGCLPTHISPSHHGNAGGEFGVPLLSTLATPAFLYFFPVGIHIPSTLKFYAKVQHGGSGSAHPYLSSYLFNPSHPQSLRVLSRGTDLFSFKSLITT